MTIPNQLRALGAVMAVSCAIGAFGCTMRGGPVSPESVAIDADTLATATTFCVDEVNRFRASIGLPALVRSARIDGFSAEAARVDGEAHEAHKYFNATQGGWGIALAENLIPWWKATDYGSVQTIVRKGLAMMWAEGSAGYHYVNMTAPYTQMGCGIAVLNGEVTVTQDFR